jgi:superfamily II DNA or RNA helicase
MIEFTYDSKKKVGILSGDLFNDIREHFSVKNEAAVFMRKFGKFMPPRTYAITPTGRFDPCLYFAIKDYIRTCQYTGEVTCSRELQDQIYPARHTWHQQLDFSQEISPLKLPLRDYQEDIVKSCISIGRGTVILATAGGKTLTSASLVTQIYNLYKSTYNKGSFKALFVVPDRGLVEQTTQDFIDYQVPFSVSKWTGDDEVNHDSNVIVANLGILQSKNSDLSWIADIDVLIIDEAHKIKKGNKINDIFKIVKTPFRFGFTGTMPEEQVDQWNIIGKIGPVIYEKNSYDLRQDSFVSDVQVHILNLIHKHESTAKRNKNSYREEINTLIESPFRNNIIVKISEKLKNNTLILVDYIVHGEILFNLLKQHIPDKQIFFVRGDVEIAERDNIRKLMEINKDVVVVAISKIFSTGINIKNLHYIIFACGGKAKIKIVQSIGRGLRLHKDKVELIIFDIADSLHYSNLHSLKRKQLYEKEHITFTEKDIEEK